MTVDLKPPLFGSPLVTALARHTSASRAGHVIPGILLRIYEEIQIRGLDVQGIFRRSGSATVISQLQAQFEANDNPFDVDVRRAPIHSLTGLFKRFLQQLPDPVIPHACQQRFLQSYDERSPAETSTCRVRAALESLPHEHLHLLLFLIHVADQVYQCQEKNHMSREALAIILAPTCVRLDAVTQLMRYSTISVGSTTTANTSTISLPEVQPTLKKAQRMFWSAIRKKPASNARTQNPSPLYQPQHLMDLDLIKESGKWTRLFEFMFCHANEFTLNTFSIEPPTNTSTHSFASQSPSHISVEAGHIETKSPDAPAKQLVDMNALEFPESIEIAKKFDALQLDFKKEHRPIWPPGSASPISSPRRQQSLSTSVRSSSPTFTSWLQSRKGGGLLGTGTKYSHVLRSWKAREQQQQEQVAQEPQEQLYTRYPPHETGAPQQKMPSVVLQKGFGASLLQIRSPPPLSLAQPTSDWIKVLSKKTSGIQTKQEPLAPLHQTTEMTGVYQATLG